MIQGLSAMKKSVILPLILLTASVALASCGETIGNAQDFVPNKAPIIENVILTDSNGNPIDKNSVTIGLKAYCVVKALDPERAPLTYTFSSPNGSTTLPSVSPDGCSVYFSVENVQAGIPVSLRMTVSDDKDASVGVSITVGTGKLGATVTMNNPESAYVRKDTMTRCTFTSTATGWYQVVESSADITNPAASMTSLSKYAAAGSVITLNLAGNEYIGGIDAGAVKFTLSAGDGVKKIWLLFKDDNNYYSVGKTSVTVDNTPPAVTGTSPTNGEINIPSSPEINIVLSESTIDASSLASALTVKKSTGTPEGTVSYLSFDGASKTARYSVSGLALNTQYTATVSGIKDLAGNTLISNPLSVFSFTTTATYAVSYNANGGSFSSAPVSISYAAGKPVTVTAITPTRTGYSFTGWNTSSDGTGSAREGGSVFSMPADDVILYAQWSINSYTVTFDANSGTGTVPSAITGNYNKPITLPTTSLTRTGYNFSGWNTAANGSGTNYTAGGSYTIPASNITLYAKWTLKTCVVKFDSDGVNLGSVPSSFTHTAFTTFNPASYACDNIFKIDSDGASYRCIGWNFFPGATTALNATYSIVSNVDLFPVWKEFVIGDTGPGGGVIFHIASSYQTDGYDDSRWRYMESYQGVLSQCSWATGTAQSSSIGTAEGIGAGKSNTALMVLNGNTAGAGDLCANFSVTFKGNTFDDWYLPSLNESKEIYKNAKGTCPDNLNIWTSSEDMSNPAIARYIYWEFGTAGYRDKWHYDGFCAHPARRF